jgi:hypothetical protein
MLQVSEDGTLFLKMCKLANLAYKKNVSSFTRRFFTKEEGKTKIHLIEPMNERRNKALMGLERNLKILKNVVDVMAQIQRLVENTMSILTQVLRGSRRW